MLPEIGHGGVPILQETGRPEREVHQRGVGVVLVFGREPVPLQWQTSDEVVIQPTESMKVGPGLTLDQRRCQEGIGRVTAIPEDDAGPVLSWVILVSISEVLLEGLRLVVMLDHLDGLGGITKIP